MILLPAKLRALANLTSRETETARFTTNALRLRELADNRFQVVATDGKVLGLVEATSDDPANYPTFAELDKAPNGSTEALIPRGDWQRMLGSTPKALARSKPILGNVACVMDGSVTTLGINALSYTSAMASRPPEGRYPNVDSLMIDEAKKPSKAYATLNVEQLLTIAQTVKAICGDEAQLTIEIKGDSLPVHVRAKGDDGLTFQGLIMPVATPEPVKPTTRPKREAKPIAPRQSVATPTTQADAVPLTASPVVTEAARAFNEGLADDPHAWITACHVS